MLQSNEVWIKIIKLCRLISLVLISALIWASILFKLLLCISSLWPDSLTHRKKTQLFPLSSLMTREKSVVRTQVAIKGGPPPHRLWIRGGKKIAGEQEHHEKKKPTRSGEVIGRKTVSETRKVVIFPLFSAANREAEVLLHTVDLRYGNLYLILHVKISML